MKKTIKKISILLFLSILMMGIKITPPVLAGEGGTTEGMSNARVYYSGASRYHLLIHMNYH